MGTTCQNCCTNTDDRNTEAMIGVEKDGVTKTNRSKMGSMNNSLAPIHSEKNLETRSNYKQIYIDDSENEGEPPLEDLEEQTLPDGSKYEGQWTLKKSPIKSDQEHDKSPFGNK